MTHVQYFKLQAKNLFRDYKTQTPYIDKVDGNSYYKYDPKYFDVETLFFDFEMNEEKFSLMKAQHLVALMVGFDKWGALLKASETELELAKLLFDNQDKVFLEDWEMYIRNAEAESRVAFDADARLEIFKQIYLSGRTFHNPFPDYRLKKTG